MTTSITDLTPAVLATLRAEAATRPDTPTPAASALACTAPIQLTGSSLTVDAATGEILHTFASNQFTDRLLSVPCGNRRETVCPACSKVYAADAYQLITAGLIGTKGVPATVTDNPRLFATFTAPSFGKVHLGPDKRGVTRPCHRRRDGSGCNRWHKADDPLIGTPLDPAGYDYTTAALWNASASALWARFTINLRRDLARLAGLTLADFREQATVAYAKVAEYQTRGAIHFHAVIRLDGAAGPGSAAPPWATPNLLADAIRAAAARSTVATPDSPEIPSIAVTFGRQLDLRPITSGELADGDLTERAVAGYIAKYSTKSAQASGALDTPVYCRGCDGTGNHGTYRDNDTEITRTCRGCLGTGLRLNLADLAVSEHIRTLIRAAWRLGAIDALAPLKLRRWAHMLGFRGHFLTKARGYSTTFAQLREARREHARTETREYLAAFGLLDEDPAALSTQTIIIGSWTYVGRLARPTKRPTSAGVA